MLTVGLAVGWVTACTETRKPETVELTIPAGTNKRVNAGMLVDVMPARLEMRVGDTLLIRNEDEFDRSIGPYFVKAGAELRFTYGKAGEFEGFCPVSVGQHYQIVITE